MNESINTTINGAITKGAFENVGQGCLTTKEALTNRCTFVIVCFIFYFCDDKLTVTNVLIYINVPPSRV